MRIQLFVLAYNLGNVLRKSGLPQTVRHWTLTTQREKLINLGAKVVRHSWKIVFQMAEVEEAAGVVPDHLGTGWTAEITSSSNRMKEKRKESHENHGNNGGGVFTSERNQALQPKSRQNTSSTGKKPVVDCKKDL